MHTLATRSHGIFCEKYLSKTTNTLLYISTRVSLIAFKIFLRVPRCLGTSTAVITRLRQNAGSGRFSQIRSHMLIESHAVAQCQLAEVLSKDGYNTLHTDGTTKYGHKYAGYQVTTEERTYTLGLRETADGTAQTELDTLNEILEDLSLAASASGKVSTEVGQKIIAQIKSTMSDRASV